MGAPELGKRTLTPSRLVVAARVVRLGVGIVLVYWLAQHGRYFMYQGF